MMKNYLGFTSIRGGAPRGGQVQITPILEPHRTPKVMRLFKNSFTSISLNIS